MIGLNFVQVMYDVAIVFESAKQNKTKQSARSINNKPIQKSTRPVRHQPKTTGGAII
jgi:hypothetical protein